MNDRYLFRGKRIDNEEWVQGHYDFIPQSYILAKDLHMVRFLQDGFLHSHKTITSNSVSIDPATLGQCTGLKDADNRLIFEGDIVNTEIAPGFGQNVKVVWHDSSWCLQVPGWEGYYYRLLGRNTRCVVVGNVHDNPELLEEAGA